MINPVQQKMIDAQLAPARIGSEIAAAVAQKSQDVTNLQGQAVLNLLESAAQTSRSAVAPGDPLVAQATGMGNLLDITA